uniref:AidA/PixA family protein n=1 Tax=Roseivirga sp. TaxID=1964215 RepID=UPI0040470CC4
MSQHIILTVFDVDGLTNAGTFESPVGANWSVSEWNKYAYMITSVNGSVISGNTTSSLTITVEAGDTICWLDTAINQGMRNGDGKDYDMVVYGMVTSSNWSQVLEPLASSSPSMNHAYISENFNSSQKPVFLGLGYPNNLCFAKVKNQPPSQDTRVTYNLKVAKLDITDLNNIEVVGWYQVDPTIIVKGSTSA